MNLSQNQTKEKQVNHCALRSAQLEIETKVSIGAKAHSREMLETSCGS